MLRGWHQRIELIGGDDPTRSLDREFGLVDRTKGESGCPTLDENQLNGIADLESLLLGEFFGDGNLANSKRSEGSLNISKFDDLRDCVGINSENDFARVVDIGECRANSGSNANSRHFVKVRCH